MRILIVGAGATGGAFGTLLQEAGRDITYLVRAPRADALRRDGLRFVSPSGDRTHAVQTLVSGEHSDPFGLIILTVKAGALESAIADLRPYTGPDAFILPILNGIRHIWQLEQEFPGQVIGGLAKIVATLDGGTVRQMTDLTTLTIGNPAHPSVPARIENALTVPGIALTISPDITGALWENGCSSQLPASPLVCSEGP